MKSIHIYKTKNDFKIVTSYKLESGSYIASEPIFIVSADAEAQYLAARVFEALNTSRKIKESEEDKFWLGNGLLKKMKESSFNKLYATSSSCSVLLSQGIISIVPYKYLGNNHGLETDEERRFNITLENNNRVEVVHKVIHLLTDNSEID